MGRDNSRLPSPLLKSEGSVCNPELGRIVANESKTDTFRDLIID